MLSSFPFCEEVGALVFPLSIEVKWKSFTHVQLFVTPWTLQFMEFSRPEYWSGSLFPSPEYFPNPGFNPGLPPCRQILYQLSHRESPHFYIMGIILAFLRGLLWWLEEIRHQNSSNFRCYLCVVFLVYQLYHNKFGEEWEEKLM